MAVFSFQTKNRATGVSAAAKVIELHEDESLDDFLVEIEILTRCKHRNVVGLHETFFYQAKLWVSRFLSFKLSVPFYLLPRFSCLDG